MMEHKCQPSELSQDKQKRQKHITTSIDKTNRQTKKKNTVRHTSAIICFPLHLHCSQYTVTENVTPWKQSKFSYTCRFNLFHSEFFFKVPNFRRPGKMQKVKKKERIKQKRLPVNMTTNL